MPHWETSYIFGAPWSSADEEADLLLQYLGGAQSGKKFGVTDFDNGADGRQIREPGLHGHSMERFVEVRILSDRTKSYPAGMEGLKLGLLIFSALLLVWSFSNKLRVRSALEKLEACKFYRIEI